MVLHNVTTVNNKSANKSHKKQLTHLLLISLQLQCLKTKLFIIMFNH